MFRIISKGRLRKLSVHQRNRICIICGLSRCSGCSDRCGWSLLYSKWQVGGKIYSTTNYVKNRYGQKLSAYEISSTFAMVTWSRITSASCVYSVTTASMHMLFCQTLSFLIPAMACSSFFASLLSSSPIFIQLNRSVNDIIYLKTSSANGSLFGSCIKSNGLGF